MISFIGIVDFISLQAFIGTSFFLATRDDAMHPKYISEGAATRACRSRMGPTWLAVQVSTMAYWSWRSYSVSCGS